MSENCLLMHLCETWLVGKVMSHIVSLKAKGSNCEEKKLLAEPFGFSEWDMKSGDEIPFFILRNLGTEHYLKISTRPTERLLIIHRIGSSIKLFCLS